MSHKKSLENKIKQEHTKSLKTLAIVNTFSQRKMGKNLFVIEADLRNDTRILKKVIKYILETMHTGISNNNSMLLNAMLLKADKGSTDERLKRLPRYWVELKKLIHDILDYNRTHVGGGWGAKSKEEPISIGLQVHQIIDKDISILTRHLELVHDTYSPDGVYIPSIPIDSDFYHILSKDRTRLEDLFLEIKYCFHGFIIAKMTRELTLRDKMSIFWLVATAFAVTTLIIVATVFSGGAAVPILFMAAAMTGFIICYLVSQRKFIHKGRNKFFARTVDYFVERAQHYKEYKNKMKSIAGYKVDVFEARFLDTNFHVTIKKGFSQQQLAQHIHESLAICKETSSLLKNLNTDAPELSFLHRFVETPDTPHSICNISETGINLRARFTEPGTHWSMCSDWRNFLGINHDNQTTYKQLFFQKYIEEAHDLLAIATYFGDKPEFSQYTVVHDNQGPSHDLSIYITRGWFVPTYKIDRIQNLKELLQNIQYRRTEDHKNIVFKDVYWFRKYSYKTIKNISGSTSEILINTAVSHNLNVAFLREVLLLSDEQLQQRLPVVTLENMPQISEQIYQYPNFPFWNPQYSPPPSSRQPPVCQITRNHHLCQIIRNHHLCQITHNHHLCQITRNHHLCQTTRNHRSHDNHSYHTTRDHHSYHTTRDHHLCQITSNNTPLAKTLAFGQQGLPFRCTMTRSVICTSGRSADYPYCPERLWRSGNRIGKQLEG
jgi:hypothetical protein